MALCSETVLSHLKYLDHDVHICETIFFNLTLKYKDSRQSNPGPPFFYLSLL